MKTSQTPEDPGILGRHASVVVVVALGLAVGGFLVGATPREAVRAPHWERDAAPSGQGSAPKAPRYNEIDSRRLGPNPEFVSHIKQWVAQEASPAPQRAASAEEKLLALMIRSSRRAYDGAPPVIPHPVAQGGERSATCMACHAPQGDWRTVPIAPVMSHAYASNCTQCHVESAGGTFAPEALRSVPGDLSQFDGLLRSGPGSRAGPGAPPVIPHSTLMRDNCLSCHGPSGFEGLRTTHPERSNCRQCHASSAELDQRHFEAPESGEKQP